MERLGAGGPIRTGRARLRASLGGRRMRLALDGLDDMLDDGFGRSLRALCSITHLANLPGNGHGLARQEPNAHGNTKGRLVERLGAGGPIRTGRARLRASLGGRRMRLALDGLDDMLDDGFGRSLRALCSITHLANLPGNGYGLARQEPNAHGNTGHAEHLLARPLHAALHILSKGRKFPNNKTDRLDLDMDLRAVTTPHVRPDLLDEHVIALGGSARNGNERG